MGLGALGRGTVSQRPEPGWRDMHTRALARAPARARARGLLPAPKTGSEAEDHVTAENEGWHLVEAQ